MQVLVQVEDSGGLDPHLELASPGTHARYRGAVRVIRAACPRRARRLVVAGGTGIAPLRAMLIEHVSRPTRFLRRRWSTAPAPVDEFAFRPELVALEAFESNRVLLHDDARGRLAGGGAGEVASARRCSREALPSPATSTCLVCGPPQLVNDTRSLLMQMGVSETRDPDRQY